MTVSKMIIPFIFFTCDAKKITFTGSYCAEAQKTRFQNAMRESALPKIYYLPPSDHLKTFSKTFSEVIKCTIK